MDEFKTSLLQIFQLQAPKQVEQEEKFRKAHLEQEEKFQERLLQQQNHLEQLLTQSQEEQKRILVATNQTRSENEGSFSQSAIWGAIEVFNYDPEKDITFTSYFRRFEDIYTTDCASWTDGKKTRLLLRKLGTTEHTKFCELYFA